MDLQRLVVQSGDEVGGSGLDKVDGRCKRHGHMFWEPGECVANVVGLCQPNVDTVTVAGVKGGANGPAINGMRCPAFLLCWFFIFFFSLCL